jgi:hypothetical protein
VPRGTASMNVNGLVQLGKKNEAHPDDVAALLEGA